MDFNYSNSQRVNLNIPDANHSLLQSVYEHYPDEPRSNLSAFAKKQIPSEYFVKVFAYETKYLAILGSQSEVNLVAQQFDRTSLSYKQSETYMVYLIIVDAVRESMFSSKLDKISSMLRDRLIRHF